MLPIRLELKNFLPYRSPDPIRFEGIHLACLTGPNGAGKSSILDAITWALWGKSRAKHEDDLIHLGQTDMYVQLDFEQEGTIYRVLRRRSHGKRTQGTLDLFIMDGDKPKLQNEPSMRQTQDKINRILRLDYETFVHSAFLQQGKADAFTTKNPAERKRILSDILGLEQWAKYEDATKDILKAISSELDVIDIRIREIDQELVKERQLQADVDDAEKAHAEATEMLRMAEESLAEVAHAPGELRRCQEQQAGQQRRLREHERDLTAVNDEITRHEERIATYGEVIASKEEIEAGYAALQSARDADTALGEKLQQLSDFDAQYHDLERQLDAARAELENERSTYLARIAELERAANGSNGDELGEVQAEVQALLEVQAHKETLNEQITSLREEQSALDTMLERMKEEGLTLRDRLAQLQASDDAVCPLCGQPLTAEHRQQLIEQLDGEIESKRGDYRNNQERITTIAAELTDQRVTIRDYELSLKRLSPLTERMGILAAQLDAANEAALRLDQEQAGLQAVEQVLEADTFAQDLRQQLATLKQLRDGLGYDRDSHDAARQQLSTYRAYETRQTELQVALSSLPEAQAALEASQARRERLQTALEEDHAELETLNLEIAKLEVLVREQQTRQQEVNKQRSAERTVHERLVNARQELKALAQQRQRKAELETRREEMRYKGGIYEELKRAFGKNGIPAMIIETAIPELESTANILLARMTDGRMSLKLTTQREKVTGGVAETLDIEIADELGTRSYELYSGGEAFRINFAIRVALSQLLARRAGAHLQTLFIDEGFGTQDDDGRNKLVEAITAIQDAFDMILVITHIDDLRDSFPVHVLVDKTPNGSRMVVR